MDSSVATSGLRSVPSSANIPSSIACCVRISFSNKMAFELSDPDYVRRQYDMHRGRVMKPKCSAFIDNKVMWSIDALKRRLSTSVVDFSKFGSKKRHGNSLLDMTGCVCAVSLGPNWKVYRL